MLSKHALLESKLPESHGVWGNILPELCPATLLSREQHCVGWDVERDGACARCRHTMGWRAPRCPTGFPCPDIKIRREGKEKKQKTQSATSLASSSQPALLRAQQDRAGGGQDPRWVPACGGACSAVSIHPETSAPKGSNLLCVTPHLCLQELFVCSKCRAQAPASPMPRTPAKQLGNIL